MGQRGPRTGPKSDLTPEEALAEPVPWDDPKLKRWERVCAFLEWLPITKGRLVGEQMVLLQFQRDFICGVYGEEGSRPVTTAVQSVPRGNGKTGLLAGLGLCHLVGPECEQRGEVYSAAIDRQQAGILFNEMEAIVYAVPRLNTCINVQRFYKRIEVLHGPGQGSVFESLSRDARRGHGLAPSFWIYDELAQATDGELLDNLITGMGKRTESLGVVISTQAPTDQHPLSEMIDNADDTTFVQVIRAEADADPFEEATIRSCNPALGHFLSAEEVFQQAERARRSITFEPRFRNLRLNQRIAAEASFVSPIVWNANSEVPDETAFVNGQVFAGLDLSARNDLTAFAYVVFDGTTWHVRCEFFAPEIGLHERATRDHAPYPGWAKQGHLTVTEGASVQYAVVAERMVELCDTYDVQRIHFDRWRMDVLETELQRLGVKLPLKPHGQGFKDMAPALDVLEAELLNERIRHGGNPILDACVANAVVDTDPAGNRKLNKAKSTGRIDGLVALAMAINEVPTEQPLYVSGALVIA